MLWWTGAGLIVGGALMREWSGAPAWRLLKNPATDWVGKRSYSIYVLHYGVAIWIVERVRIFGHPRETYAILLPLTLVATLALATASWHLVEQPFLRLRKRRTKASSSSGGGTRTHNPSINSRVLYRLSYPGTAPGVRTAGIYRLSRSTRSVWAMRSTRAARSRLRAARRS